MLEHPHILVHRPAKLLLLLTATRHETTDEPELQYTKKTQTETHIIDRHTNTERHKRKNYGVETRNEYNKNIHFQQKKFFSKISHEKTRPVGLVDDRSITDHGMDHSIIKYRQKYD